MSDPPTLPKQGFGPNTAGFLGLGSADIFTDLESALKKHQEQPESALANYFDFVCSTCAGAIAVTCIASGMSVEQTHKFLCGQKR